ncbi:cytoskeleton protein RodZ [Natronospira proteinivora]|uniref:Cytoskeleton protein RodZ n=1 Tax=Natronospira proteinivora TaxID=1807133 RepID=A0ABT1GAP9_9GAMM|nr:RodZ family helix-turn-helix domain-containing protein [Natronospira proteinivora]MCP1727328.1 cytoskeleton protein RodZ [Natronospira proteinivora]
MTDDPSLMDSDQGKDPHDTKQDDLADKQSSAGPGERLRQQREDRGLSLGQAAQELRVLSSILQALEENRFEVLEAPIFVRGHLRNYARLLELPETEVLQEYEATLPEEVHFDPKVNHHRQEPVVGGGTPRWIFPVAWLVVIAMLLMGALWWYAGPHRDPVAGIGSLENNMEAEAPDQGSPENLASASGQEEADGLHLDTRTDLSVIGTEGDTEMTPALASAGEEDGAPEFSGLEEEIGQALDDRLPEMETGSTEPVAEEDAGQTEPETVVPENAVERALVLEMTGDSWLEVRAADGEQLFYGLAQEGQHLELDGLAPIELFMGNAPAIELQVDGESMEFSGRIRNDNTARVVVNPPE